MTGRDASGPTAGLRSRVVSALRWSAAARLAGQLFSWAVTILVIRLLSPGDYGLMAMAMVVVSCLVLLNTLGLDAVLVQARDLGEATRRQVFGLVIATNTAFFFLLFLAAPGLAAFYAAPDVVPVLRTLSLVFLLLIFETLPQAQLERGLHFRGRSLVDLATLVAGSLTTLVLAWLGHGVWALVWGTLVTNATRVLGLNLLCRALVWPSFSLRGMAAHLSFGGFVSIDRGLWYLYTESDKFIGGKLLGQHALGYYAVAAQLASMPINKVSGLLNAIAFPAFAETHGEGGTEKVRDYLCTATRVMAVVAFPVFFGLSCTAAPLIAVLLGEQWQPAAPLLVLLGLVMPFRLLSNVFAPLLWGIGRPAVSAGNFLIAAIVMPLGFLAGSHWGAPGLAGAWLALYPLVFLLTARRTCRAAGLALPAYLSQLLRPLGAGLIMYASVYFLGPVLGAGGHDWLSLLQLVIAGAIIYVLLLLFVDRAGVAQLLALLRH